ncbi:PREDICTED: cytochrome P450 714C2-like [Ipomoea nil]|uniref:cytochrome P450 714C2-like n=1 Tax=Ipomoea nil TaxID=35883 RepID=UPI0009015CB8|nr:PREDICTED: cytochrome P450 714C2-like [Ipomoea nil]
MEVHILSNVFISLFSIGVLALLRRLYEVLVAEPARIRRVLKKQGIDGPPPAFLLGNISEVKKPMQAKPRTESAVNEKGEFDHNWINSLFPFFDPWRKKYGELFVFSLGTRQILYVNNPDMVKEITTCKSYDLGKPRYHKEEFGTLLGEGILTSNGQTWAYHRKVLAPELYMEKVKGMTPLFAESARILVESWKAVVEAAEGGVADVNIDEYMRAFSGDVISRACFGSSYERGKEIFNRLKDLQEATSAKVTTIGIPGLSRLPTKGNREGWALDKEIHDLIIEVVKERKEKGAEKDLLQMVVEGAEAGEMSPQEIDAFIVSNCKNVYLAAHEASAIGASWCLMLLAAHPDWQHRCRAEIAEICHGQTPDAEMLRKMKTVTMVLQETLRLYPSGPALAREALNDIKIGGYDIPKGVNIWTMVETLHVDTENWGPDALSFNPERFANGVSGACKQQHSFLPFGFGPRLCVGQHLAMVELKMLVSALLTNFSFSISPKYIHSPALKLVIKPEFGVDLLITKL